MFQKATKTKSKLRLTIDGPAGSGKTYSSLQMASALENYPSPRRFLRGLS